MEIRLNNIQYSMRTEFKEFTLREGGELHKIIFNAPESLKQLYNATSQEEIDKVELSDEDTIKLFPNFYGDVIAYCAKIPQEEMDGIMSQERIEIYKGYIEKLVMEMIHLPKEIESITEIEWQGETYYLPEADTVLGAERLGAGMVALEFTEQVDVRLFSKGMEGGMYENAANVISILARPKADKTMSKKVYIEMPKFSFKSLTNLDYWKLVYASLTRKYITCEYVKNVREPYDEKTSLARAEMFMDLPLDVVHSVFFSLIDSIRRYSLDMLPSLIQEELGQREQVVNPL